MLFIGVTFQGFLVLIDDRLSKTIILADLPRRIESPIIRLLPMAPAPPVTKIFFP